MSHLYVCPPSSILVRAMPPSNMGYALFICVPCLIHMCAMPHPYVCHASSICVPCLLQIWVMTHSSVCHDSFIRVPCLIPFTNGRAPPRAQRRLLAQPPRLWRASREADRRGMSHYVCDIWKKYFLLCPWYVFFPDVAYIILHLWNRILVLNIQIVTYTKNNVLCFRYSNAHYIYIHMWIYRYIYTTYECCYMYTYAHNLCLWLDPAEKHIAAVCCKILFFFFTNVLWPLTQYEKCGVPNSRYLFPHTYV